MSKPIAALAMMLMSLPAFANWTIDNDQSRVSFTSIKKTHIAEVHHFTQVSGTLSSQGVVSIAIDLSSAATGIAIRDDRLREFLFETAKYANATISAQIDMNWLTNLALDEVNFVDLPMQLALHGMSHQFTQQLMVTKLSADSMVVMTTQPIVINARDFQLIDGIEKLKELAGLPSISYAVPVTATIRFTR